MSKSVAETHINQINQAIKVLRTVKNGIIHKTEDAKLEIKHGNAPVVAKERILRLLDRYAPDIDLAKMISDEVFGLVREIEKEFDRSLSLLNLRVLDNVNLDIPEDLSQIQNLHDVVVQDLEDLKNSLQCHVDIIEKTELINHILNYKVYDLQYNFRTEFDKLKDRKESLLKVQQTRKDDPGFALKIVEVDDEISKLEESNQKNLECIKEQKLEAQKSYERAIQVMDSNFVKLSKGLNKLQVLIEAEKSHLSDSQAQLVDAKFAGQLEHFNAEIEKFTALQTTGWKVVYPDEKLSEFLEQKGLKLLQTGQLITGDGHAITFKQAKDTKLLDNLSSDMLNDLKANLDDQVMDTSTTSSVSTGSRMSSEDVSYLKESLGKPLALALAEITTLQPRDPIHYLGHWLFKYRYNQQIDDVNKAEMDLLNDMRSKIAQERWHKFIEDEARAAVIDMITRAEQIAILNELRRIQKESEAMEEMENLDDEARDTLGPL